MCPRVLFHHSNFDSTTSKKAKSRLLTPVPPKECGFGAGPQELEHDPHVQQCTNCPANILGRIPYVEIDLQFLLPS
jgi:hypothetical protein